MGKRARPEEKSVEATSEEVEHNEVTASEGGTAIEKVEHIPVGRTTNEGKVGNPEEVASGHVAEEEMPGAGPFWELLALAGYKPW